MACIEDLAAVCMLTMLLQHSACIWYAYLSTMLEAHEHEAFACIQLKSGGYAGIAGVVRIGIPVQAAYPSFTLLPFATSFVSRVSRILRGTFHTYNFEQWLSLFHYSSCYSFLLLFCS